MRRLTCFLLISILILLASSSLAQQSGTVPAAHKTIIDYHLEGAQLAKAEALYKIRLTRYFGSIAYSIVVLLLFLLVGVGPLFRDLSKRVSRHRYIQAVVFTPLLVLAYAVLMLPIDMHGHYIARAYGMSVQHWPSWLWDWTKEQLITLAIASLLVMGLYWLIRRSPRRWWLWAWMGTVPLTLFAVFISPLVIDPLFNHYEPLAQRQPELVRHIQRIVQRASLHIPESRMYEMRASDKVTTYNAYVTGVGVSKRVVVWDTTARDLTTGETLFIFGHEMGHYVLHHIWKGLAFFAITSIVGFWIAFHAFHWLLKKYGAEWGITDAGDLASLPALMLVAVVLSFVASPIGATFSRHIEHEADIYGLEVAHGVVPNSSEAAASSFQKLGEKSYSYPHPNALLVFWDYDHPPIADRVRFAQEYRPWDEGKPTQFVH